jgi:4-hydroxy-tetrahydrodipicolinate synthase
MESKIYQARPSSADGDSEVVRRVTGQGEVTMTAKLISGLYAALLTPRHTDDNVDVNALHKLVRFLTAKGVSSFAVNGATGEFCLTTPEQLRAILTTVRDASEGTAKVLCGIGAPSSMLSKKFAAVAESCDVAGLLLPMPYFFPYQQEDLDLFCRDVSSSTSLPILLYNLPQFTSGLEKETVSHLITEVPNIVGIKDSSGSLEILRHLTEQRVNACRIVGNDSALAAALREGIADGVVSGVACALPEVIQALWGQEGRMGSDFENVSRLLDEFIHQLNVFPTPWGLKWVVETRGIVSAQFLQPVTEHRLKQARTMETWLNDWLPKAITHATGSLLAK